MFESLPEPVRPPASREEKKQHRFYLAFSLNIFVLLYHLLHKLVMPVGIALASGKSIQFLDWWWIYHVVLALMMKRKKWDDEWLLGVISLGWGGVAVQIVASFMEYNWHRVSLWVTAGGTIGVLIFLATLITRKKTTLKSYAFVILGLLSGFIIQWTLYGFSLKSPQEVSQSALPEVTQKQYPLLAHSDECGISKFSLGIQDGQVILPHIDSLHEVQIKDCGFNKALGYWDKGHELIIENESVHYLNVKLFYLAKETWKPFRNFPLRPNDHVSVAYSDFESYSAIMIVSDSHPKKGILVLISSDRKTFQEAVGSAIQGRLEIDRQRVIYQSQE